jgi:hypothetical protein
MTLGKPMPLVMIFTGDIRYTMQMQIRKFCWPKAYKSAENKLAEGRAYL